MTSLPAKSTRTALPTVGPDIDYELFLDCVHCGLCTSACPTYVETGDENDSPRGRIYLMRAIKDGRIELDDPVKNHLDLCLDCRACESACPSGVQYGKLIESFRVQMQKSGVKRDTLNGLQKYFLYYLTPYASRMKLALTPAWLGQRTGVDWLIRTLGADRLLPQSLRDMYGMLPRLTFPYRAVTGERHAKGNRRARVALFTGCAADAFYPRTNYAAMMALVENGCDVWIPPSQGCCGALHYHAGYDSDARAFARQNLKAFLQKSNELDAIITNAAGCGAMLKDYGHLFHQEPEHEQAGDFASKVKDVTEFLMHLGPVEPTHSINLKATYHDACHLCHGQQIRKQPRQLLEMIPGLTLASLIESELCCGAAGSYNLTQPAMAERLGQRKAKNVLDTGADTVFSANVGCLIQLGRYLRAERPDLTIAHPIDALWASYSGEGL